ncbi:type IV pilus assembly protein PilM [Candidatus Beckwithbacteria bacterium]|nr:type IV pilus assembly protein PilM [Candidatus Beckwithbacteria bacterium]
MYFALDVSSASIKVAQARKQGSNFELIAFGEIKNLYNLYGESQENEIKIAQEIKNLLKNSGIRSKEVYLSLSENDVFTRVIQMPFLKTEELETALSFEAEQYIPVPLDNIYLQYEVIFTPPKGVDMKMELLLIAAKKQIVDKLIRIVQMIELTPLVIETSLISTIRALKNQFNMNSILLDCGNTISTVVIFQNGKIKQISSLPTAGQAITRAIMTELALPEKQAQQYKHIYGLDESQLEGRIARIIKDPIDQIITHVIKNIRFAKNNYLIDKFDRLVISGGTSLLPNFSSYLVEKLDMEVSMANPLEDCLNKNLPQQLISAGPRFAAVFGLATRD